MEVLVPLLIMALIVHAMCEVYTVMLYSRSLRERTNGDSHSRPWSLPPFAERIEPGLYLATKSDKAKDFDDRERLAAILEGADAFNGEPLGED